MTTDSEIIRASRADPSAFGALFERHARAVHRYVAGRAGVEAADEVLSETFTVAFERRARFDPAVEDARPWLLGIATNVLQRHRRQEARHLRALARGAESTGDGGIGRTDERADALREVGGIAARLRALPAGDRDVLLLHAWAELSSEQIAAALGIPVGTVRSRLFRVRRTLRIAVGTSTSTSTSTSTKEEDRGRSSAASPA